VRVTRAFSESEYDERKREYAEIPERDMNFRTDIKINLEMADMKILQRHSNIKYTRMCLTQGIKIRVCLSENISEIMYE